MLRWLLWSVPNIVSTSQTCISCLGRLSLEAGARRAVLAQMFRRRDFVFLDHQLSSSQLDGGALQLNNPFMTTTPTARRFALELFSTGRRSHRQLTFRCQHRPQCAHPKLPHQRLLEAARHASTTTTEAQAKIAATRTRPYGGHFANFTIGTLFIISTGLGYLYITDTRASVHEWLSPPAIRFLYPDAEDAHHVGTSILKALWSFGLHPRERPATKDQGTLSIEVFGHVLDNPIAISAGLDKDASIPDALFEIGPGIVEVGGVTPFPQEGNPKPRVFRLPSQNALINRYGLNSEGADFVAMRLRQRVREFAYFNGYGIDEEAERIVLDGGAGVPPGSLKDGRLLAVQIAKAKTTPEGNIEAVKKDYTTCVEQLGRYADIIVVNVSSPNTPGLRSLQSVGPLTNLLTGVVQAAKEVPRKSKPAVMVKVSPDEDTDEQVSGICEAIWDSGVDGVIVGNTTKKRPDPLPKGYVLEHDEAKLLLEQGGYSGPQLFERTVKLVSKYRKILDQGPKVPEDAARTNPFDQPSKVIFATGGIATGKQVSTPQVCEVGEATNVP